MGETDPNFHLRLAPILNLCKGVEDFFLPQRSPIPPLRAPYLLLGKDHQAIPTSLLVVHSHLTTQEDDVA